MKKEENKTERKKLTKGIVKDRVILGIGYVGMVCILAAVIGCGKTFYNKFGSDKKEREAYFEQIDIEGQIAQKDLELRDEVYSNKRTIESYLEQSEANKDKVYFIENFASEEDLTGYQNLLAEQRAEIDKQVATFGAHNVAGFALMSPYYANKVCKDIKRSIDLKKKQKERENAENTK